MSQKNPSANKKKLLKALRKTKGLIQLACKISKVSSGSYYDYYNEDPAFKEEADAINEELLDEWENKMQWHINNNSEKMLQFALKAKGKKRGFSDSSNLDITTNGESITNVNITETKKKDKE